MSMVKITEQVYLQKTITKLFAENNFFLNRPFSKLHILPGNRSRKTSGLKKVNSEGHMLWLKQNVFFFS